MNDISEQVLQAIDILVDNKTAQLQFDKTIQCTIYSIVNLDSGEYKVRTGWYKEAGRSGKEIFRSCA